MKEQEIYWVLGDRYIFHHSSPTYTLLEIASAEGHGPPPHIHEREDEAFYVLEGALEVLTGEKTHRAEKGSFVHIPKGTLHTYKAVGNGITRHLVTITPGGFEQLFRAIGTPAVAESSDPRDAKESVEQLLALAPSYGLIIPPPQVS